MNEVYVVYAMVWPNDNYHKLDKIFANEEDANEYCKKKEKAAAKKGFQYETFSEWYVKPIELN